MTRVGQLENCLNRPMLIASFLTSSASEQMSSPSPNTRKGKLARTLRSPIARVFAGVFYIYFSNERGSIS